MSRIFRLFVMGMFLVIVGCSPHKKRKGGGLSEETTRKSTTVKSVELAEAILWPKPYRFPVTRDPFKPLLWKSSLSSGKIGVVEPEVALRLIGVVVLGDEAVALIGVGDKTSTVHEGDNLGGYKVERITPGEVVLDRGKKKLVLKMKGEEGGDNENKNRKKD